MSSETAGNTYVDTRNTQTDTTPYDGTNGIKIGGTHDVRSVMSACIRCQSMSKTWNTCLRNKLENTLENSIFFLTMF